MVLCLAGTAAAGTHKDERWGFKIKYPDGWTSAAMSASEEWIAAKFLDKREVQSKRGVWLVTERPQIWVIGFSHAKQKERGAKTKKKDNLTIFSFKSPYKDYKDFIKRESWFVGGGYHFSKEEKTKIGEVEVTQYEIKVEKTAETPFRIVTWVYHFEDVDFAVQCKVLEDYYKKYRVKYKATLKSFKRIPRKKAMPGAATTGKKITEFEDEDKMTAEERAARRKEKFETTLRKEIDALPKGWYSKESEHYVVLSNAKKTFSKEILNHSEAIRGYLDKTFGNIGSDYVPRGIIRVFKDPAEEKAYRGGTASLWGDEVRPVLFSESRGITEEWAYQNLNSRLTDQYFGFKNKHLANNMPWWFRYGLTTHMEGATTKGKKVIFKKKGADDWGAQEVRKLIDEGKALPLEQLFRQGSQNKFDFSLYRQAGSVCAFLLTKGNRGKTKGIVQKYLVNLIGAIESAEAEYEAEQKKVREELEEKLKEKAEEAAETGEMPETENEESEDEETPAGEDEEGTPDIEELSKKSMEAMNKKEAAILKVAFEKTFGHLKPKDWKRLDKMWRAYAK
ncbi:MAG: hypothetical protein ACYTGZ_15325 [Planctomycetota bacterium]